MKKSIYFIVENHIIIVFLIGILVSRAVREEETALMIDKIKQSYSSSSSPVVNLTELFVSLTNDIGWLWGENTAERGGLRSF